MTPIAIFWVTVVSLSVVEAAESCLSEGDTKELLESNISLKTVFDFILWLLCGYIKEKNKKKK